MRRWTTRLIAVLAALAALWLLWPWHLETFGYTADPQPTDFGEMRARLQGAAGLSHAGPWPRVLDGLLAARLTGPPYALEVSVDVPGGALGGVTLSAVCLTDAVSGARQPLDARTTRLEPLLSDTGSVFRTEFGGIVPPDPHHDLHVTGLARLAFKDRRHTVVAPIDIAMKAVHEETWTNGLRAYWEGM